MQPMLLGDAVSGAGRGAGRSSVGLDDGPRGSPPPGAARLRAHSAARHRDRVLTLIRVVPRLPLRVRTRARLRPADVCILSSRNVPLTSTVQSFNSDYLCNSLVLVLEFTKVNLRALLAMGTQIPWALAFLAFTGLAYFTMNVWGWRVFLLVLFLPFLIFIVVSFTVCNI